MNISRYIFVLFSMAIFSAITAQNLSGSFENKFKRYSKNEQFSGNVYLQKTDTVWKGDRVNFQMLVWSQTTLSNLQYEITDFISDQGVIPSDQVVLRFGTYVKGDAQSLSCASYPSHTSYVEISDALSNTIVTTINPADPLKLWLTIDIPSNTSKGLYKGSVIVKNGTDKLTFSIQLLVVDISLPSVSDWNFHLDLWQFPVKILDFYNASHPSSPITIWSDQHFQLFKQGYKILADMGQKAITAHIKQGALGQKSMIKWIKNSDATWSYDYGVFDKYVDSLMTWGIDKQINCFSPVGWNNTQIPFYDNATKRDAVVNAAIGSTEYNSIWNNFLTDFRNHLIMKNWFTKAVLYLDEVPEIDALKVIAMIKNNDTNWKVGIAYAHEFSQATLSSLYDVSGILEVAKNDSRNGLVTTFYTSCTQTAPNNYITPTTSTAEMTWIGWYALKGNFNGYLRWAYDYWQLNDPFDARDGGNTAGDFSMIYRGQNDNISNYSFGLRNLMLREGIQDYEKVKILKSLLSSNANFNALNKLNDVVNLFTVSNGNQARSLVSNAQSVIKEIVTGKYGSIISTLDDRIKIPGIHIGVNSTCDFLKVFSDDKIISYNISDTKGIAVVLDNNDNLATTNNQIAIHNLVSGIYIITLYTQNTIYSAKFLK